MTAADAIPRIAEVICLLQGLLSRCPQAGPADSKKPCDDLSLNVRLTCTDTPVPISFAAAGHTAVPIDAMSTAAIATVPAEDYEEPIEGDPVGGWAQATLFGRDPAAFPGIPAGSTTAALSGATRRNGRRSDNVLDSTLSAAEKPNAAVTLAAPMDPTPITDAIGMLAQIMTLDFNGPGLCTAITTISAPLRGTSIGQILRQLKVIDENGQLGILRNLWESNRESLSVSAHALRGTAVLLQDIFAGIVNLADFFLQAIPVGVLAQVSVPILLGSLRRLLTFFDKYLSLNTDVLQSALEYVGNYVFPTQLPSPAEAHQAYLAGQISEPLWLCWTRANGILDWPAARVRDSQQSRLPETQLLQAWMRGRWSDAQGANVDPRRNQANLDVLKGKLRERGWLDKADIDTLIFLSTQIPAAGDLIRFMTRDVDDPNIVQRFELDREFTDKFVGKTAEWAANQGLDYPAMIRYWRAHWAVPSATQLYEMSWRFRPNKVGQAKDALGFPLAVDQDDLMAALNQNDVAPYWRDKLRQIAFRVLRQVDSRRGYNNNDLTRGQLASHYQDIGYTGENLNILMSIARTQKRQALRRHWAVTAYRSNLDGRGQTIGHLLQDGFQLIEIEDVLKWAEVQVRHKAQGRCLAAVRRQFLTGFLSDDGAIAALQQLTLDVGQVSVLVSQWKCERSLRPKSLSAAQLCKAAAASLITHAEYDRALQRLGYSAASATALVALCDRTAAGKIKPPPQPVPK